MMMMMSAISPVSSAPRLSSTALVASATGKKEATSGNSLMAKMGVIPPAPQALTKDVFTPSVSLKLPEETATTASAATTETPILEEKDKEKVKDKDTNKTTPSIVTPEKTTETKPLEKTATVDATPEKIEASKAIMSETETKLSAEKDPTKAKKLLNDTYAQLKTLSLPKENLIVLAMQLDVWDASIVNLLPANDKPAVAAGTTPTSTTSVETQTPAKDKDTSKEANKSVNLLA